MKRFLSLVLVLVMMLGMMPMALASNETPETPAITVTVPNANELIAGSEYTVTLKPSDGYKFESLEDVTTWPWGETTAPEGAVLNSDGSITVTYTAGAVTDSAISTSTVTGSIKPVTGDKVSASSNTVNVTVSAHKCVWSTTKDAEQSVAATCTTKGKDVFTCTVTGCDKINEVETEMIDHDYENGVCTVCGAAQPIVLKMPATLTLKAKENGSAAATWEPAQTGATITYSSSDDEVATVSSNGTVTAVAGGTATITATGVSGDVTKTATCIVTVTDDVYITVSNDSVPVGSTATITPKLIVNGVEDTSATFTFSSNATAASNGKSATVRSTSVGIVSVTVTLASCSDESVDESKVSTKTAKVSFYDSYEIEVTMKGEMSGFKFTDTNIFSSVEIDGISKSNAKYYSLAQLISFSGSYSSALEQYDATSSVANITYVDSTLSSLKFNPATENNYVNAQLGGLKFTCLRDGEFVLLFKSLNNEGLTIASGWVDISVKAGTGDLVYNTTFGKEIQFDEDDFEDLWKDAGMSGYPSYVIFGGQPTYGDLYTTKDMTAKATTSQKFYFGTTGTYLFDNATYMPMKNIKVAHEDEIPFVMYGTSVTNNVSGIITIKVGQNNPFKDVKESDYFYDAVMWAVEEEITTGTSATTFSPSQVCTRGQVVTFLWRAAGEPEARYTTNPFSDVKKNDYFYEAVLWAYEEGITTGTTATTFGPNQAITRSQAVTFLYRYHNEPTVTGTNSFVDVSSTAYYDDAVTWAVKNGITTGMSATKFAPNDGCTRAQIVTFLYRDAK